MKVFQNWYISTKLLLINLVVFGVMGGVIAVVFFSFSNIEHMMRGMVKEDVSQVIENGSIGRKLTTVFADTSPLINRFLDEQDLLETEGNRLTETITALVAQSSDARLQQALQEFIQEFQSFFEQGSVVVNMSRQLNVTNQELESWQKELKNAIANTIISVKINGRDPSGLERLNLDLPWYHEALLRVNISLYQIVQQHLQMVEASKDMGKKVLQILILLDELDARLQPLTGSEPAVKDIGQPLKPQELVKPEGDLQWWPMRSKSCPGKLLPLPKTLSRN